MIFTILWGGYASRPESCRNPGIPPESRQNPGRAPKGVRTAVFSNRRPVRPTLDHSAKVSLLIRACRCKRSAVKIVKIKKMFGIRSKSFQNATGKQKSLRNLTRILKSSKNPVGIPPYFRKKPARIPESRQNPPENPGIPTESCRPVWALVLDSNEFRSPINNDPRFRWRRTNKNCGRMPR